MLTLFHDFLYSLRLIRKSPLFYLTLIATVGIGMGMNAAAFNLYNILVLRPLPVSEANRVVRVLGTIQNDSGYRGFSYPNYQDYRDSIGEMLDLAAYSQTTFTFSQPEAAVGPTQSSNRSREIAGVFASGNYFSALRAGMVLGQPFSSVKEEQQDNAVAVLRYRFWQNQLGGDPEIVGKTIRLNGILFTVLGVTEENFVGTEIETPDVWVPIGMQSRLSPSSGQITSRGNSWLVAIGRLKPAVSMEQAQAAMSVVAGQLAAAYPVVDAKTGVKLGPGVMLTPDKQEEFQTIWLILMAATVLLLIIVCANAASLMIARAISRTHELALRAALGARRLQLFRLLITESMTISVLGGVVGLGLGSLLTSVLLDLLRLPGRNLALANSVPDIRLGMYGLGLILLIGIVFAIAPLTQIRKSAMYGTVQLGSHTASRSHRSLVRKVLMTAQIAFCCTLLVGAGLLVRGFKREQLTDPGFLTRDVVVMSLQLRGHGYSDATAVVFRDQLIDKINQLPGVKSVSVTSIVPLGDRRELVNIVLDGPSRFKDDELYVNDSSISPEYFSTLNIPLVKGRLFNSEEVKGNVQAVIVNEAAARKYWPGENPLGKRISIGSYHSAAIIGIVKDTRSVEFYLAHNPIVYLPITTTGSGELILLVHASQAASSIASALPGIVHSLDNNLLVSVQSLTDLVKDWTWPSLVAAWAAIVLSALATILASMGLYAVIAYSVNQRVREIGVRMALGAKRADVLRLIVKQGLSLSVVGLPLGLVGGFVLGHLLEGFLYGVSPADPLTLISVPLLIALVTVCACYLPALRASRIDPAVALRTD